MNTGDVGVTEDLFQSVNDFRKCTEKRVGLLPEILHVVLDAGQGQGIADRADEGHRLGGRAPVHI